MKSFVGKILGRSDAKVQEPQQSAQVPMTPQEIRAFDQSLTHTGAIPFYPLSQTLLNKEQREKAALLRASQDPVEDSSSEQESTQVIEHLLATGADRYADEQPIGEGGTAVVYRATDTRLNRPVALKRFKSGVDSDYMAELASASRVRHPNVVSTFDADIDDRGRFIVMELIDGQDAEEALADGGKPFDINTFINFAIQSLEGLHATHQGGLLHLDIKPSNIMISKQLSGRGIVKLVDFGRATLIAGEHGKPPLGLGVNGSIFYSAPEQLLSGELDIRTDLYALGCVFYWVLTGKRPFRGDAAVQVMAAHIQNMVQPLHEVEPMLPQWLSDWVMSLISLEKDDRPNSVMEAMDALLDGERDLKIRRIDA